MASISKLSIRGIRSFSPDDQEQTVTFFFPLTIIVGDNGCGKTTIIESLKYALSGSLPPGNKSGQAFVHDPKSIGHAVVKASVKLRFTNKAATSMAVVRSMELTQKKANMTFKQLDGVIRTVDARTNERISLSHKCTELDRQIPQLMGVSKAILDYVLFVHQEESSWPLAEAAILKKRFDDIFDSTRYSKALESFRKTRKDLSSKVKDYKAEVAEFKSHKFAAQNFRKDIEKQTEILERMDQELKEHDDAIEGASEEQNDVVNIIRKGAAFENRIKEKKFELTNTRNGVAKQRSMLEEDLTKKHTIKELKDMLRDFDKGMKKKKERQDELQRQCEEINEEIEELRQKEMDLNSSKGKYMAEKDAHDKRLKDRIQKMETLAQNYTIDLQQSMTQQSRLESSLTMSQVTMDGSQGTALSLSKDDMDGFFNSVDKKEEKLRDNLKEHKDKYRNDDSEIGAALQELYGRKSAIEHELKKLSSEQEEIQKELRDLEKMTGSKRIKKSAIDDLRESAKLHAKELEKLNNNDNRDQITAEIRSCNEKIEIIKEEIETKMSVRQGLQNSANLGNRIAILKDQCKKDLEGLQESLRREAHKLRHSYNIQVPDDLPTDSDELLSVVGTVCNGIASSYEKTRNKLAKANEKCTKARQVISRDSATLQSQNQSLATLSRQRDELEQDDRGVAQIRRILEEMRKAGHNPNWTMDRDPQQLVAFQELALRNLEEDSPEDIPMDVVAKTIKRIRKLGKKKDGSKRQCPCCCRDLNEEAQRVFNETMNQLADPESSPLVRGDEETLKQYRAMKADLESWRTTVYNSMADLNNYNRIVKELKELEPKAKEGEASLKFKETEFTELESQASELQEEENNLRSISDTSRRWLDDAKRIAEQKDNINVKMDQLRAETSDSLGETSLETVEEQLNSLREEKDSLVDKINKLNRNMTNINQQITAASQKASNTAELLRQREEKYAQEHEANEKIKRHNERKYAISQEKTNLGEQMTSLQSKIKSKEAERTRMYHHSSEDETRLSETLNAFLAEVKSLRDLNKLIEDYRASNKDTKLDRISADVAKINGDIQKKKEKSASLQPELEVATKAVNDQQRHETFLSQNIDLLEYESQIEDIEKELSDLREELEKLDGYRSGSAQKKYDGLLAAIQEHASKKSRLEGRRQEIVEQIRSLNRKLSSEEYKNVDEQYRSAVIKKDTTEMAMHDLDKYASALDKALLRFHVMKLEEINKIIKDLWLMCYKGEDITNIEIVSGQEKAAAKSYNYRVVMTKGSAKMDMRGRCSAGQRVLASIVIRLALAETFGVSCGCLVLDEPTVNLDHHNRMGLATALAQIVAARAQQSNFQLVLITHDEDFVALMKGELSSQSGFSVPEKYYQVRREEAADGKYYSKIDAIDWDELL